jgi:hypothetical protein
MQYAEDFISTIRKINPEIAEGDYEDAISFAMTSVPLVKDYMWLGQIGRGVFYADSSESRWFPNANVNDVAKVLAEELY